MLEADEVDNSRPRSLPELFDFNVHETNEEEIHVLMEMLQDAIGSNPNLEQCLNELDLS